MKIVGSLVLGAACLCLACGCRQADSNIYSIDVSDEVCHRVDVTTYGSVKLETTEESLVYSIGDIIPFHGGYLIPGREKVLYFLKDGSYVARVGQKGRGPGEYLDMSSCYVYQDTVHVFSYSGKDIHKYVLDEGDFVAAGEVNIPDSLSFSRVLQTDLYPDCYFVVNTYRGIGGVIPNVSIFDMDFKRLCSSASCVKDGGMQWNYPFSSTADGVYFAEYVTYTLTELRTDAIDETRHFDFGVNNYPDKYVNYTNSLEAIEYFKTQDTWNKTFVTIVKRYGDSLYVMLSSGRLAKYNLENGKSEVVRFMKNSTEYFPVSTFLIEDGYMIIPSEVPEDMSNPSLYRIPLTDIFRI